MKYPSELEQVVEKAVLWYADEAASLRRQLSNVAFLAISEMAIEGLRKRFQAQLSAVARIFPQYSPMEVGQLVSDTIKRLNVDDLPAAFPPNTDVTLKEYLRFTKSLFEASTDDDAVRNVDSLDDLEKKKGRQFARNMWAVARDARIFDFKPETWMTSYRAADVYTTEKIANEPWFPYSEDADATAQKHRLTTENSLRVVETISEAAHRVPFPDPLPFERMYIGLGPGALLTPIQVKCRIADPRARTNVVTAAIVGYLLWQTDRGGYAAEIVQIVEAEDNYFLPNVVCHANEWVDSWQTLAPWVLTHLVGAINEHRQIIVEKAPKNRERYDWQKAGKKMKVSGSWLPKPYYVVHLQKELIDRAARNSQKMLNKISRELTYRFDRRGHERCYIRRGPLPLNEEDRLKLLDAGYKLWTIDEPDSAAYRQLMERGQRPKAHDEWLAILTKWIDPTIIGPDHLPYMPAMRVVPSSETT